MQEFLVWNGRGEDSGYFCQTREGHCDFAACNMRLDSSVVHILHEIYNLNFIKKNDFYLILQF